MVKFLVNDLGVSQGHIQCLLSTSSEELRMTCIAVTGPTRKNIIDTLLSLSTRRDILPGDNIVIYFAGHGSWYDLSDLYGAGNISAEGSIEAICPIDRNTPSRADTSIPDNHTVPCQSNRHNFGTRRALKFCSNLRRFLTVRFFSLVTYD